MKHRKKVSRIKKKGSYKRIRHKFVPYTYRWVYAAVVRFGMRSIVNSAERPISSDAGIEKIAAVLSGAKK